MYGPARSWIKVNVPINDDDADVILVAKSSISSSFSDDDADDNKFEVNSRSLDRGCNSVRINSEPIYSMLMEHLRFITTMFPLQRNGDHHYHRCACMHAFEIEDSILTILH